jgi:hypothetical protein
MNDAWASLAVVIIGGIAVSFVGMEVLFQISCASLLYQTGRSRYLPPSVWAFIIIFIPVVGGMLYLTFGSYGIAGLRRGLELARESVPRPGAILGGHSHSHSQSHGR